MLVCFIFSGLWRLYADSKDAIMDMVETVKLVPMGGNSWDLNLVETERCLLNESGLSRWQNDQSVIRTYFHLEKAGEISVSVTAKVETGSSKIQYSIGKVEGEMRLKNNEFTQFELGRFTLAEAGYHFLELAGLEKTGLTFAEISQLELTALSDVGKISCVSKEFYWGRRGPSVHLNYPVKSNTSVKWFYSELTVPAGEDVIGSYFMANGFGEGYFGIQVNSASEKRIIFSVWSPFQTDNPEDIPTDMRISLLSKGRDVHTGKFGNEGSGGQSYRKYNWQTGTTYRFLLKGEPKAENSTDYTAWFFAPEIGKWELIASFKRPQTNTYLTHLHSFLENFIPENGNISRMGLFANQWICDESGTWQEITKTRFTADNTARKGARLDYKGGVQNGKFYLKNCGFFTGKTEINSVFERSKSGSKPEVNLLELSK